MTQFVQHDLGHQKRGATAVVTLRGNAANVRLLDSFNFSAFKNGRRHNYRGGLVKSSPYRVVIPSDGRRYVTVDLQGQRSGAKVNFSVHIEPPPLSFARSASRASLDEIRVERPPAGRHHRRRPNVGRVYLPRSRG